ncbi:DUF1987 domain-containing protein [Cesiribacter sp. SM1]|uniref:DUF1987 domain-containing protein n=1 Tax=Cesiribacter sp. SM1 TaxID=2861196 RepID=UPI001CD23F87|nr:DUF1987 domain-containing protein [Cesiribacter sp. SM1]
MLKTINLERRPDTPAIKFDPNGTLSIAGRSLPENAESFYKPLIDWVARYAETAQPELTLLTIELEYFNSSSVKQILMILLKLEELHRQEGKEVQVVWSYNQDDELMEMKGREMESLVDLPFSMQAYSL